MTWVLQREMILIEHYITVLCFFPDFSNIFRFFGV